VASGFQVIALRQGITALTEPLADRLLQTGLQPAPAGLGRRIGRVDRKRDLPLVERLTQIPAPLEALRLVPACRRKLLPG
jgi:hypothetical protein